MYVVLGLIVGKWIGISFSFILIALSLKDLSPVYCQRSRENATKNILDHMTKPGECCFNVFKRCCVATKQVEYFNDVADFINNLFPDGQFVPSDVAAALILLSIKSESSQEAETRTIGKNRQLYLKNLEDYMAYATTIYGTFMYIFDSDTKTKHFCNILSRFSPNCCLCSVRTAREEFMDDEDCCACHLSVLRLHLPHLKEEDIVYLSLRNDFLETPFMIVADKKLDKLVISIRGTLSISDLLTDMVARPVSLKAKVLEHVEKENLFLTNVERRNLEELSDDIEVHAGMLEASLYIFKKIREKHLLDNAKMYFPDFSVVVTGHSLGAGTSVILAFLLKLKYSDVKCYAFGPPGALLNQSAYNVSKQFVTSIVVGDDIVPRLSYVAYGNLRRQMKRTLRTCRLPKHKVLATGFCTCLSPITWKERLKTDPSISGVDDLELDRSSHYGSLEENGDLVDGEWPGYVSQEMLPPGNIIHLKENDENITMSFRDPKDFQEMVISTKMINDHAPSAYQKMLAKTTAKYLSRTSVDV